MGFLVCIIILFTVVCLGYLWYDSRGGKIYDENGDRLA